jgi:bile acid:Na+ symporter, BASS family
MQQSLATEIFLPVALGIIMLGLGLSLSIEDFKRVARYPKSMTVALVCQMFLLPALCFFLVKVSGLEPALAVGLMLLAASHCEFVQPPIERRCSPEYFTNGDQ